MRCIWIVLKKNYIFNKTIEMAFEKKSKQNVAPTKCTSQRDFVIKK